MSNWLTYSPTSGHGNGIITITANTLSELEERTATIIASNSQYGVSDSVLITQYKASPTLLTPLTFNILSAGTINWTASGSLTKTIEYKLNDGEWASIASNTGSSAPTINVVEGDKIQFRGNNAQYGDMYSGYNTFSGSSASFEIEGNIMSLIYGDDFKNNLTINDYAFTGLFRDCTGLTSAENLILPATTLTYACYKDMFRNCTSLTTAPELPATTLANWCYSGMFWNCTSLTTAPALPATNLADYCYSNMLYGCTSLTTAPSLPATNLANYCYVEMFRDCSSLTTAPSILPATTLVKSCYQQMFWNCTSLTTAPALPATTLAEKCYSMMFWDCYNLNYIKCLATDISEKDCTEDWVFGVASTGTFVKPSSMTSWTEGISGIPTGWTVVNDS